MLSQPFVNCTALPSFLLYKVTITPSSFKYDFHAALLPDAQLEGGVLMKDPGAGQRTCLRKLAFIPHTTILYNNLTDACTSLRHRSEAPCQRNPDSIHPRLQAAGGAGTFTPSCTAGLASILSTQAWDECVSVSQRARATSPHTLRLGYSSSEISMRAAIRTLR